MVGVCAEWEEGRRREETASGSVGFGFTLGLGEATKGFNMEEEGTTSMLQKDTRLDHQTYWTRGRD